MTFSLENAVVYDIETFPNAFTLNMQMLHSDVSSTWEISHYRDDRRALLDWFNWLANTQTPMIGFNSVHFDYPVIHYIFTNPNASVEQIYDKAQSIITSGDRFGHTIWPRDRFAPQIDLFKINHFDNKAKSTSLKALQINMRSESVVDMPVEVGTTLSQWEVDNLLIPYNQHDVSETKKFAKFCKGALEFRIGLIDTLGIDVLNFDDTKIGAKILETRLGDDVCYTPAYRDEFGNFHRKQKRQTIRDRIAINDIIFPYVGFRNSEFNRVLDHLRAQVLEPDEYAEAGQDGAGRKLKTKGVFTGLSAHVGGMDFHFGVGGIHGSVAAQVIRSDERTMIRDIDVAALYPNIGIVNKLAPAHLGPAFVEGYSQLPKDRKRFQTEFGKKSTQANSMKLASNGTYGNTNNPFSVFYDPQYTMTITINGQLMLCMLAERLSSVPTFQPIQINTDGITYKIDRAYLDQAKAVEQQWQDYTHLVLEDVEYRRMWIRDVNNYIAEDMDGNLKQKGAYWHPGNGDDYAKSIAESQPPAWHKDLGNLASIKAAVAAMVHGVSTEWWLRAHSNPWDFMCRAKVGRSDTLLLGEKPIQKTTRYYVAQNGLPLTKIAPPAKGAVVGTFKRANGIDERTWRAVNAELQASGNGDQWDARIHTKNQSRNKERVTNIEAGWKIAECNDHRNFSFDNLDYAFYIAEAEKLVIR